MATLLGNQGLISLQLQALNERITQTEANEEYLNIINSVLLSQSNIALVSTDNSEDVTESEG